MIFLGQAQYHLTHIYEHISFDKINLQTYVNKIIFIFLQIKQQIYLFVQLRNNKYIFCSYFFVTNFIKKQILIKFYRSTMSCMIYYVCIALGGSRRDGREDIRKSPTRRLSSFQSHSSFVQPCKCISSANPLATNEAHCVLNFNPASNLRIQKSSDI